MKYPIAIWMLAIGAFAIGMTEFVIMGLLPNIARDFDVTVSQAGQLITGYALGVCHWWTNHSYVNNKME